MIIFIRSGDWLLGFLYRTLSMTSGVAGLTPINCKRIVNIDLSSIVGGHSEYPEKLAQLLSFVGLNTKEIHILDTESGMKKSNSEMPYTEKVCIKINKMNKNCLIR